MRRPLRRRSNRRDDDRSAIPCRTSAPVGSAGAGVAGRGSAIGTATPRQPRASEHSRDDACPVRCGMVARPGTRSAARAMFGRPARLRRCQVLDLSALRANTTVKYALSKAIAPIFPLTTVLPVRGLYAISISCHSPGCAQNGVSVAPRVPDKETHMQTRQPALVYTPGASSRTVRDIDEFQQAHGLY